MTTLKTKTHGSQKPAPKLQWVRISAVREHLVNDSGKVVAALMDHKHFVVIEVCSAWKFKDAALAKEAMMKAAQALENK